MLFVLFNLTFFEAVSQQNYVFPIYDPNGLAPNYPFKDWKPTGLTPTINSEYAHSFNTMIRISKQPDLWENIGGILISNGVTPQANQCRVYSQDNTIRLNALTNFNDVAYVPKSALERLYNRIKSDPNIINYMNGLSPAEQDSIYKFMFPAGKPANNISTQQLQNLLRPGLLIAVGDYTTIPKSICAGENPVRSNAAIYVIDAVSLLPIRFFKFFQCSGDVVGSNFTAIRYLDIIDRYVAVGSCQDFNNNTDILSFSGDLFYLAWEGLPPTSARTHRYNIKEPYLGASCNDIATGVDLRYFKTSNSGGTGPTGYYTDKGAIMISAYLTNTQGQEKSVLLRLNHDGTIVAGRTKNAMTNNRAHAVSFLTDDFSIWEGYPADLGVTGYVRVNQVDNMYIAKFDHMVTSYADGRYPINNTTTEKPGFSIVSTGDGYAVTGRYQQLNTNREHLSYLRVDTNLTNIEHTIFPFGSQSDSYGQRMHFTNGSGLMLGGTKTDLDLFGDCSCDGNSSCNCPAPLPQCDNEWQSFTKDPLTLTQTNSSDCHESTHTQSNICSSLNFCWLEMTVCTKNNGKNKYDVCQSPLPNGTRSRLFVILGRDCHDTYCKDSIGTKK